VTKFPNPGTGRLRPGLLAQSRLALASIALGLLCAITPSALAISVDSRKKIMFSSGGFRIYVMNDDGSGLERIGGKRDTAETQPVWSSDGKKILFLRDTRSRYVSHSDSGRAFRSLWMMNADGSGERGVYQDPAGLQDPSGLGSPSWSPDGAKIAFTHITNCGEQAIYVMNADGTGLHRLGTIAGNEAMWSRTGRSVVFTGLLEPERPWGCWVRYRSKAIFVMNADGTGLRRLSKGSGDESPAWSPNGRRIAFTRWTGWGVRDDTYLTAEIYVMDANGNRARRLTRNRLFDGDPNWSPDGRRIVFTRDELSSVARNWTKTEIYVMNANGSRVKRLTDPNTPLPLSKEWPSWQPT